MQIMYGIKTRQLLAYWTITQASPGLRRTEKVLKLKITRESTFPADLICCWMLLW